MEINRMIALYMGYCQSRQLREKTMLSYEQSLKLFAVWLQEAEGITQVEHIKEGSIRRYIIELQTRGKYTFYSRKNSQAENEAKRRRDYNNQITNVTINNYLRNIRPFFSWLLEEEIIAKSPFAKVKKLPQQRTAREYLSDDEVKRLLKSMDTSYFPEYRDKLVMMIMLDSGTRLGETLSIEMDQIDLIGKTIHLPADKTKGRAARTVFFSNKVERELRRWLQNKDRYCESAYAFPVKHSGRAMNVSQYRQRASRRTWSGIPRTAASPSRTSASRAILPAFPLGAITARKRMKNPSSPASKQPPTPSVTFPTAWATATRS